MMKLFIGVVMLYVKAIVIFGLIKLWMRARNRVRR